MSTDVDVDVHGSGWRLVVRGTDARSVGDDERAWFDSIGGRVVALAEPDPLFVRWFIDHDTTCALQRPELHLHGSAPTAAAATALLADLRSHLTQGTTT